MKVSMGAPNLLRGGAHSGNVSAAELAAEGLLDNLASDYVPGSLLHAAFRLTEAPHGLTLPQAVAAVASRPAETARLTDRGRIAPGLRADLVRVAVVEGQPFVKTVWREAERVMRSEEHTSELQSLMRISYAVFCLKKKKNKTETYDSGQQI